MASSKNGRGVAFTVEGGGRGLNVGMLERGEGGVNGQGRGEQGMRVGGKRGVYIGQQEGGRRGRALVCTCSARERIRRSIGGCTITPSAIWPPSDLITWPIHISGFD